MQGACAHFIFFHSCPLKLSVFSIPISHFQVTDCQQYLKHPEAVDGELEPGAAFWCHFCEQSVQKHVTDRTSSIKFGGLFQHFSR